MRTKGYRQSKNIEDLRDKPVGPKRVLKPTKAKKIHESKSKLLTNAMNSEITTRKKSVKTLPSTENTFMRNRMVNYYREGAHGDKLGLKLKNKKLDSKPTRFEKKKK